MLDPFSTLPLPLPTFILNGLDDLGALHSLLQASPAADAIFAQHYCEVLKSVMGHPTLVPKIRQLLRVILLIRSWRGEQFWQLCASVEDFKKDFLFNNGANPLPISKDNAPLAAARSLARTAS